jgi:MFS family permease
VLWTLPLDIAGKYAGTAGGMMNTGFGVAGMISPVVFGYLIQETGSYNVPFTISACLLAVGLVAALFIDTSKTVEADEEREEREGLSLGGEPAFVHAGQGVRMERHHLRRPLRWKK